MVESIKELRKICGSKKKQPLYMELICMKISIYITKLLLYTKISADYITMAMMLLIITGSVIMAFGDLWMILIGILIIHLTVILDIVNGEVARYRKEDSIIGTFLEQVYHNLVIPLMFFSLAYSIFLKTGFKSVLIFGFMCSVFGKPIILNSINDAIVHERLSEIKKGKKLQKIVVSVKSYIKGGHSKTGKKLYKTYDLIRNFWVFPANIIHINILAIIELINFYHNFMPPYLLFIFYILFYGTVSTLIQLTAFIVNYKGKTVNHYYRALFGKK